MFLFQQAACSSGSGSEEVTEGSSKHASAGVNINAPSMFQMNMNASKIPISA